MAISHPVAKAIVLDSDGKFLLLTRSDSHPTLAGFYDIPGGMVEPGEEPGAAVAREIAEETGLDITTPTIMYAVTMLIGGISYPTLLYKVSIASSSPAITVSWEHKAYEWADIDRLVEVEPQLAPTYRQALRYVRDNAILEDL